MWDEGEGELLWAENIREGNDEVVDELVGVIQRLMK